MSNRENSALRLAFERELSEFLGRSLAAETGQGPAGVVLDEQVRSLFDGSAVGDGLRERFNSILVHYGICAVRRQFFLRYLGPGGFASIEGFALSATRYQMDAMRLFSSFDEAFPTLSRSTNLNTLLAPLAVRDLGRFHRRSPWTIEDIPDEDLPQLGYVVAAQLRSEAQDRGFLVASLRSLADSLDVRGRSAIQELDGRLARRIDTLLRRLDSSLTHGVSSPLFAPDPDELRREANRLEPKDDESIQRIARIQIQAQRNLARYLSADFIDVYVAASMRVDADFVSVNRFAHSLLARPEVGSLRLRLFNPTQSWVADRIAKGLVKALMLRRAAVTIYLAQKGDTFGKDSEASVALGQGKTVIVYVPKLRAADGRVDSEELFRLGRVELLRRLRKTEPDADGSTGEVDDEVLLAQLMAQLLRRLSDAELTACVRACWADFDLYGEAHRLSEQSRGTYRAWLDAVRDGADLALPSDLSDGLIGILVATSIRFEQRAELFRDIHPLALQVVLSTGLLNGMLVTRSAEQCSRVLRAVLENDLNLKVVADPNNYRLVEQDTGSTIRVISRNQLLRRALSIHYPCSAAKPIEEGRLNEGPLGISGLRYFLTPEAVEAGLPAPSRAYEDDAGFDLRLLAMDPLTIPPHERRPVPTGVGFDMPSGWYGLICNRTSGGRRGLLPVAQVVDANFTGVLTLTLHNTNAAEAIVLEPGERVAQIVFMPTWSGPLRRIEPQQVKYTERGSKAYGSSGSH